MNDCTRMDAQLLDGSPEAMAVAERHAAECPVCAETLAAWREISETAASLRTDWHDDLLWRRIEKSIAAERRSRPLRIWQAAAAVLLFAALGGTMVYALRVQSANAVFDGEILRVSAMDEVERAERAHLAAIDQLENIAEERLENDDSPLMVSYKEKLMLLDDAIAECEAAIERNRQNAHLRKQLLAMYSEKQSTLQDVLREEPNETN